MIRRHAFPLMVTLVAFGAACSKADRKDTVAGDRATAVMPAGGSAGTSEAGAIVVNGRALSAETVGQLQRVYPVAIAPGRYWYDAVSGAYGREGGPAVGQMIGGLALGGPLRADASHGTSGVFINGRQITVGEKTYLERVCQTPVAPARYWILVNGVGGFEGGPASFDLGQCPGVRQQNTGSRSSTRTYCDGNGACTSTGILGSITTSP